MEERGEWVTAQTTTRRQSRSRKFPCDSSRDAKQREMKRNRRREIKGGNMQEGKLKERKRGREGKREEANV